MVLLGGRQKRHGQRPEKAERLGSASLFLVWKREGGVTVEAESRKTASWKVWNSPWQGKVSAVYGLAASVTCPHGLPQVLIATGSGPHLSWEGPWDP